MSVFENINHVWISTVLISIWGFVVPGVAILIVSHLTVILAFLVSTIGLKYATIINASYHNAVFNMVQSDIILVYQCLQMVPNYILVGTKQ